MVSSQSIVFFFVKGKTLIHLYMKLKRLAFHQKKSGDFMQVIQPLIKRNIQSS
ncbi:hypothetical protein CRYUN_Cryun36dG0022000 [Craigia yunnanensis]